jgi:DNA primase
VIGVADQIAETYLQRVKLKDKYVSAACPFHKGGQERHPSFWVNRETGAWGCFTCSAKGSSLKYLLRELNVHSRKIEAELEEAEKDAQHTAKISEIRRRKKDRADFKGEHILPDALLGVFDFAPVGLLEHGFMEQTLRDHDVGYDQRNNRITFPIRDIHGNLVGISGRATMPGDVPKYLIYNGQREIDGKVVMGELGEWYPDYSNEGVRDNLWRGHLVYERLFNGTDGQLIVVEGFKAAMWLVQCGWNNVVATMGTKMTSTQERIIRHLGAEVFVFSDNGGPGREAAHNWCQRLAVSTFPVYRVDYPQDCDEDAQPDGFSPEELEVVLSSSQRVGGKFHVKHVSRMAKFKKRGPKEKLPWQ